MDGTTRLRRPGAILSLMVVSLLIVVLDNSILNVALRRLADPHTGLGAGQGELEWAVNAYTLVFASLLFAWSYVCERFGRRRALLIGLVVFGAGSVAAAYSRTPGELIAARAVMGLGAASVQPVSLSIVTAVFPPAGRAKAIGIWSSAAGAGLALGPLLGGVLLEHFWWGSIFLINVPLVVLVMVGILAVVPESGGGRQMRLDVRGLVLSVAGMFALTYGVIHGGELGRWSVVTVWGPLLGGAAVLVLFAVVELRSPEPILDVRLFTDSRFAGACAAIAVAFFGLMGVVFALLFYLQSVRDFSPLQAAACAMPIAIAQLLVAPRAGQIIRTLGHRNAAVCGLATAAACLCCYGTMSQTASIPVLEAVLFLHGVSLTFVIPPVTALMMGAVPADRPGAGAAANTAFRQIGTALGVAVLGALLSLRYRDRITGQLGDLPAASRAGAAESIEKTLSVASASAHRPGVPAADGTRIVQRITDAAHESFVAAMHVAAFGAAAVTAVGAVAVLVWLPGRPGAPVPMPEPARAEAAAAAE
ncbi:MAG: MFS transporter [Catenulispora sp.]|nr:MFS transporter [Catenulispora sp.]